MMKIAVFVALLAAASAVPTRVLTPHQYTGMTAAFESWMAQHEKSYATEEERQKRFDIFVDSAIQVEMHNSKNDSFRMALNQFSDLTLDEFLAMQTLRESTIGTEFSSAHQRHVVSGKDLPPSIDWRTVGLVTDVKNQGQCGSCWAFSTVVSLEGQSAKKANALTSYSEQDLVDCVKGQSVPGESGTCCDGCQGGLMDSAFAYMIAKQSGADDTESAYPYKGVDGTCAFSKSTAGPATVASYTDIKKGDEDALKDAVANVGPVSVAVDANLGWQMYGGGIYKGTFCGTKLNHGVAVVGYGSENGVDYWIIKNSWGSTWGEKGYMRMKMGKNVCGVANSAVYPVLA